MILKRDSLLIGLVLLLLMMTANSTFANKWYVNSTTGDNLFNGKDPVVSPGNVGPFAEIQWAIMLAMPGDSVYISDGYYYGNINVDKSLYIFGNNSNIAGNGTRNLETILLPTAIDLNRNPTTTSCVINITAPGVQIYGIRVDGDNTNLSSGNDIRGRDVDVSHGVRTAGIYDNTVISNCVFENLHVSGVAFWGDVNSANFNCVVSNNQFLNFGNNSFGIECKGFYANLLNNHIEDVTIGIRLIDFKTSNGRLWTIQDNMVIAETAGMMIESFFQTPSELLVNNNTFTTPSGYISDYGIYLSDNRDDFKATFSKNKILNSGEGYSLNNNNIKPLTITNDTFLDCDYGLRLLNFENNKKIDTIAFTGCQFNNMFVSGIDIFNDSSRIDLNFKNCIFKNSASAIILKGHCKPNLSNTAFDNIKYDYLYLDDAVSGILNNDDIDATSCTFDGLTGAASTDSVNFLTEDKFRHFLDEQRFSFITFKPEHIYITSNDGNIWMYPAMAKASDNWHIFIDSVDHSEDVVIDKQIHIHTRGKVSIGSFLMNTPGKSAFMHGPIYLSNTLTLNNGILNTTDGVVTVGQPLFAEPFNAVSGGNAGSYVDGPLRIVTTTKVNESLYFPIGKANDFRPIKIITEASTTGSLGILEAELFQGPPPFQKPANGITHVSQVHHWLTKNIDNLSYDNVNFEGSYGTLANNDQVGSAGDLRLVVEDNNQWSNLGGTGSSNGSGIITSSANNVSMSFVVLANNAKGANALGKSGAIGAFDVVQSCFPDSVQFTDISATNGGAITQWSWDFGDMTTNKDTSNLENPKYQYSQPGTYEVALTVTNASAETNVFKKFIEINPPPTAGFEALIPCFPSMVTFNDTSLTDPLDPINMWEWDIDGVPYSANQVLHNFASTGTYNISLKVTTQKGCVDSTSMKITQGDSVKIRISPAGPLSVCDNDKVTLTASANILQYLWSTGDTTQSIDVSAAKTYKVVGINSNLCTGIDSVVVSVLPSPSADAGLDQTINFGESVTLNGSGSGSYDWSPAATLSDKNIAKPIATPTATTSYILRVYDGFGCEDYDTVVITVEPLDAFEIPNLITPNGDGHNDAWDLSVLPGYDSAKITVISRWGKQVFLSYNYKNNWEGTFNNQDLPDGSYLYIIENKNTFGIVKGTLQILR